MNAQTSYDQVAEEYGIKFADEMSHKPFDRKMLDWLIEKVGSRGSICDMGCGPGQIARYLHSKGASACGADLSPEMVRVAGQLNPEIQFSQTDMLDIRSFSPESLGGIAAFYCFIHIPRADHIRALMELKRVLKPGGVLLLTFHIGQETVHLDEWWNKPVDLDFHYLEREDIKQKLEQVGFILEESIERDPYPEVEFASRRAYLFARKPEI